MNPAASRTNSLSGSLQIKCSSLSSYCVEAERIAQSALNSCSWAFPNQKPSSVRNGPINSAPSSNPRRLGAVRTIAALALLCAVFALPAKGDDANNRPNQAQTDQDNSSPSQAGQGGLAVAANPGAVNITVGNGKLGRWLGLNEDYGLRLGGVWVGDASGVLSGGLDPGRWGLNELAILDVSIDAEKRWGLHGTSFGTQYLDFNGQPTNILAGSVQGFDGLQSVPPLNRSELYQMWWRQTWFDGKLITRLGKSVPTYDFDNVLAAVPVSDDAYNIPAVSSLIYTPIFVNPTMLGRIPGYYDSSTA